jgi:penicillin amidase
MSGACGGDDGPTPTPGPFDDLELGQDITITGLDGEIHVARDQYGVAHIHATTIADLAFAQGYVMAHDRLPQMDILRRFGSGRLAELFGGLDQGVIDTDLEMRVHRMRPIATQSWATLQASTETNDRELVTVLQRFSDGVNAYNTDAKAGRWTIDSAVLASFDPQRFVAWDPVDTLVLGRFQAFALSWTTPIELDISEVYQGLRETFDEPTGTPGPEVVARAGISKDILPIAPVGRRPTIDGFPNVGTDTGSRSDGSAASSKPGKPGKPTAVAKAGAKRPHVPRELFAAARKTFGAKMSMLGLWDPHAFMAPKAGSNDWVVADEVAGGKTMVAGDQHLQMPNPSIFYPVHLMVPDVLDAEGVTFPGIPGIILGHNGKLAWSSTVVYHDVNDVYLEDIQPCATGGGECAQHADNSESAVTSWDEHIDIGVLGTITGGVDATYETVEGHGPIIPTIEGGHITPRTGSAALSVEYTGYDETFEIRATYGLMKSASVDDGFAALHNFEYGGQNWVLADNQGNIGWSTNAKVPLRSAGAYTWNPNTNPDGLAPFFILPGDGTVAWEDWMSSRYIPHSINPAANYLVTANADPVGANFDNDPFNGPVVDGRPLWVGTAYAAGVRQERIRDLLDARIDSGDDVDLDYMARVQTDSTSNMGRHLRDAIAQALDAIADPTGHPADVATYVASLSQAQIDALQAAHATLEAWSFETTPAVGGSPSAQNITDSTSTTIFNHFMHFFIQATIGDELEAISFPVFQLDDNLLARTVFAMLEEPETFVLGATTGEPIICDRLTIAGVDDSCTGMILRALDETLTYLASASGFGSADQTTWRWGELHRLVISPLFPNSDLEIPQPGEAGNEGGFPRAGDNMAVNRADCGWGELDFSNNKDGPAQRFLAEIPRGGTVKLRWALPGGTIYDRSSPHYRDLLDDYYLKNEQFDAPYAIPDIVAAGEERWIFH